MTREAVIGDFEINMTSSYIRIIEEEDIVQFASVTEDNNPVHVSREYAAGSIFKQQVAHGMLTASFFSKIFGTQFPGPGCIYLSQSLFFKAPVFIGDTVKASVILESIDEKRGRLKFTTKCTVENRIVTDGVAEILIPRYVVNDPLS
jgi:3-hydroxybutyryl-CoA dehydratase